MSKHYKDRYYKFIEYCKNRIVVPNEYTEKHHIEPESLYPELAQESSNIVTLTAREHYLAHWMLAKIYGGKMWFAFNMMKRICVGGENSALYELSRKYVAEQSSILNTGRKHSDEARAKMSEDRAGSLTVRDEHGNHFAVQNTDPRYLSGELVHVMTGRERADKFKKLLSDKYRGRKEITDGIKVKYIHEGDILPVGWRYGHPEGYYTRNRRSANKLHHYHNPETGETYRGNKQKPGFVRGRKSGVEAGLEKMNSVIRVYDIRECKLVVVDEIDTKYQTKSALNAWCVQIGDYLFDSAGLFREIFPFIDLGKYEITKVRSDRQGRATRDTIAFRERYDGKTLDDLEIKMCKLREWRGTGFKLITRRNIDDYRAELYEYGRSFIIEE